MESLFKIFLEYGWPGLAAIVAALGIYLGVKYLTKKFSKNVNNGLENIATHITESISSQNDNLIDAIQNMNSSLVATINDTNKMLVNYVVTKDKSAEDEYTNKINSRIAITESVNQKLKDILLYNNAQHVFILEFHNSSHNFDGVPFAKFSCNFEWFVPGQIPLTTVCKNFAFSIISTVVKNLVDNNLQQYAYQNIAEIEELNPVLYNLLLRCKAHGLIYNAMYNSNNNMVGLLVLEFGGKIPEHVDMHKLLIQTAEISSILNLRNEINKEAKPVSE